MNNIHIRIVDSTTASVIHTVEWPQVPARGDQVIVDKTRYTVESALWQEQEEVEVGQNISAGGCGVDLFVSIH